MHEAPRFGKTPWSRARIAQDSVDYSRQGMATQDSGG